MSSPDSASYHGNLRYREGCELVPHVWGCAQVVVRVRPTVSRPVNGKDLWFVRKTAPDSVAVGDRSFPVDGVLDDRASQVYQQALNPITPSSMSNGARL